MPRNTRNKIAVIGDNRALNSAIVKRVSIAIAREMVTTGIARVACSDPVVLQLCEKPKPAPEKRNSPVTIIKSEVEANAFAAAGFRDFQSRTRKMCELDKLKREIRIGDAEDWLERTVEKVNEWPHAHNYNGANKAVRVGPAGVDGLTIVEV